ncbi:MAG: hypothetical protein A3D31_12320 [Candidatus Fluviicola riflensis]|nr:MAG: hypothetical protein CHH17_16755 [Candidatus Fluviicola riflensis]OGS77771.1 MAG: hypothetical protein A3D31_12320 [Candidatus Fluviicola riflensis]OGS84354.1 MAG: hypothetical protein A3E30_13730 [Fluviicola sp. RIFCSPHIGHO2_12_FULL_43_24]OGS84836.1 MAG: hypothetical protein A2724_09255 [Fluviicola sp. RIFCSPHIGHO2_01_FULL_43_53]
MKIQRPMNKIAFLIVVASLLIAGSCTKEIEYKGDNEDPVLVLNCIAEKDSVIEVELSKSRFFLASNNEDYSITSNAIITLVNITSGQTYVQTTPDANGKYVFPITALGGNSYSISASHPDFETVTSTMSVLYETPILSVDTSSYSSPEGGTFMKANVTWNDPAGTDFYILKLSIINTVSGLEYLNQPVGSNDQSMDELSASDFDEGESFYSQLFFTDELFDGSQKTLEIRFPKNFNIPDPDDHYKFTLYRCTEATYKYLVSTRKAEYAANDFFSEPVKVFTNIENGYGIFGALSGAVFVK